MTGFVPDFAAIPSAVVEDFDGSELRAFKDCHRGERCFILGNGPSLLNTDLAPLADEITFGVNGIFFMTRQCGFAPTYYVVEDNHVFADDLDRIEAVDAGARFFPSKYRAVIEPRPDTHFLPTDWSFYWGSSEWYETPRFSHDVSRVIYAGQTVTFLNIQLAAYMGCREIYLVGVDYDYKIPADAEIEGLTITSVDDDPNHFHPDYFGKGKRWHLPKLDNVGKAMLCAKDGAEAAGATLFNATVGGKLEVFPRVYYPLLVGRPAFSEPNTAQHYLLSRAFERAARLGLKSVSVDPLRADPQVGAIVSASPLHRADDDGADIFVSDAVPAVGGDDDDERRHVALLDDPVDAAGRATMIEWFTQLLVDRLATRRAAFWTRSVLELSPDGESVVIPALGRLAQRSVDPTREFGLDGLADLDGSRAMRWVYGRKLSIDQIREVAAEVVRHGHSVGVVDGYLYVQSRWRPTERPSDLLTERSEMYEGGPAVGLRT